jgi:FkbM family methyltransferase
MKVEKLMANNQPNNWFNRITEECRREYPIHLVDIHELEWVVDCGCNVGGFAEAWKDRFSVMMGIDASSYNIEQYQSRHQHPTMHKALWKADGEILQLRKYMGDGDDDTNSGNFSITGYVNPNNKHGFRGLEYENVETLSLETLIEKVGDIGLLKVDIEGAEFDFLYGKDLRDIKYITGEFHNWLFTHDDRGVTLLEWIKETHDEVYSDGNGLDSHYVKLYKRKDL